MTDLIADIGGTNARFALVEPGGAYRAVAAMRCAEHRDVTAAVRDYLARAAPPEPPRRAAFCVASAVTGDIVALTNHPWTFSIEQTRRALGLERLTVINDFAAAALSLPRLDPDDVRHVGGPPLAEVTGLKAPKVVLGPGTGLGLSALVPLGERWVPLASEGGHATMPAVTAREDAVVAFLRRSMDHVSAERVVSGRGLVNLYRAIAALDGRPLEDLAPPDVTARAERGSDPACAEAVAMFCALLGTFAGNMALAFGAQGGVYVAGGIVPKLGTLFTGSEFRARFEAKGRFRGYLQAIPTAVVTHPIPAFPGLASLLAADGPN